MLKFDIVFSHVNTETEKRILEAIRSREDLIFRIIGFLKICKEKHPKALISVKIHNLTGRIDENYIAEVFDDTIYIYEVWYYDEEPPTEEHVKKVMEISIS